MERYFKKLPHKILKLIYIASQIARRCGCDAYLVGGFVRDLVLGVPNLDLDVTIEGDALNFAVNLARHLNARLLRHRRFKTATVTTFEKIKIDIATARKESYQSPASLPLVEAGNIKDDLKRRDFSINTLAIRIYPKRDLKMIDFFNGRGDLRKKKIRILHDLSFIDDPTRILRAIRFEQRYNFKIETHTLKLLKKANDLDMLNKVNPHRLKDEIVLIFKEGYPIKYIKRIKDLIGFSFITPKLGLNKKKIVFFNSIQKTLGWFKKEFPHRRALDSWLVYFIGLVSDLKTKDVHTICRKFAFSRGETKRILSYREEVKTLETRLKKRLSASLLYRLLEPLSYEVILLIRAHSPNLTLHKNIDDFLKIYNGMRLHVTGHDLVRLGIPVGPDYKKLFTKTLYARLDNKIRTKNDEIEFIKKLVRT